MSKFIMRLFIEGDEGESLVTEDIINGSSDKDMDNSFQMFREAIQSQNDPNEEWDEEEEMQWRNSEMQWRNSH